MHFENEGLLQGFLADKEAFSLWIGRSPELVKCVLQCFETLKRVRDSDTQQDLQVGRDAANTLVMIGRQGGFEGIVAFYTWYYEYYCRSLLQWYEVA